MPGRQTLLIVALLLTVVGVAAADKPCVHEGQEYEDRSYMWDGEKCWICDDGTWVQGQVQSERRCTGKH